MRKREGKTEEGRGSRQAKKAGEKKKKSFGSERQKTCNIDKGKKYHKLHSKAQQLPFSLFFLIDIHPKILSKIRQAPRMQTAYLHAGWRDWPQWCGTQPTLCAEHRNGKQMPHKMPWHEGCILIHLLYSLSLNNAALLLC